MARGREGMDNGIKRHLVSDPRKLGCAADQPPSHNDAHVTCKVEGFLNTAWCCACTFTMVGVQPVRYCRWVEEDGRFGTAVCKNLMLLVDVSRTYLLHRRDGAAKFIDVLGASKVLGHKQVVVLDNGQ